MFTSRIQSLEFVNIFKWPALTYADGDHPQEHFAGVEKTVKGIGFDLIGGQT